MFKIGKQVTWTSQAGGYINTKIGKIVAIIRPGYTFLDVEKELRKKTDFKSAYGGGGPRDHESYAVLVPHDGPGNGKPTLYWPQVKLLTHEPDTGAKTMSEDKKEVSDEEIRKNIVDIQNRQKAEKEAEDSGSLDDHGEADDLNDGDIEDEEDTAEVSLYDVLASQDRSELEKRCQDVEKQLEGPAATRKQANDQVKAILSDAEAHGMNREAVKLAHKFLKWDNSKRDSFIATFHCS
jgi:hypothetical protein